MAESTIRGYVRERKIQLALIHRETFIPQSYVWGGEAQVDWYEAYADICGEREKAYIFCMRSMASGGADKQNEPLAYLCEEDIWEARRKLRRKARLLLPSR